MTQFIYCEQGEYTDEINQRLEFLVSDIFQLTDGCPPVNMDKHFYPSLDRLFYECEALKALFEEFIKVKGEKPA